MKKLVAFVVPGLVLVFVAVTFAALEGSEVAVLRTAVNTGQPRDTRVWVVDFGGSPWIEAANPERQFYRDILVDPNVELSRKGQLYKYRAVPVPGPGGHQLIRVMLAEKYGWADRWVGLLADTSSSVAIRLEPR